MKKNNVRIVFATLVVTYFAALSLPAAAESVTDCVGRMQIDLPGEVEQAAIPFDLYRKEFSEHSLKTLYAFSDGQSAGWSKTRFAGQLLIAGPISAPQRKTLLALTQQAENLDEDYIAKESEKRKSPSSYQALTVAPQLGYASRSDRDFRARLSLSEVFIEWRLAFRPEHEDFASRAYNTLIAGLRERPLFNVPHEPGVCLPYAFIRDDGSTPRSIGMTYRLKAHPDVTIWLDDTNAAAGGPHVRAETLTARYRAKFFWEQDYQNAKRVESEWTPGYRRTTIDGRDAIETFVKLVRYENNIEDYGYLAVVRGDPDAAEDTPDLMLYVIRDAANATKRGLTPIDRDELLDLARRIASSIRRRPVGATINAQ